MKEELVVKRCRGHVTKTMELVRFSKHVKKAKCKQRRKEFHATAPNLSFRCIKYLQIIPCITHTFVARARTLLFFVLSSRTTNAESENICIKFAVCYITSVCENKSGNTVLQLPRLENTHNI